MKPEDYTPEQVKDVEERVAKAKVLLKELELVPSAQLSMENNGENLFGIRCVPYLQDVKFSPRPVESPFIPEWFGCF